MSYRNIALERDGAIARLWLQQPEQRNAMTPEMGVEVKQAVAELNADSGVRVVVVRGRGESFSAGGNLKTLVAETRGASAREQGGLGGGANFYRLYLSIRDLEVPSIAAINGAAIGAGFCFALACDLRVAHERAKMGMTFVKLGIHPGMAATWTLPRLIGAERAAELLYTGRLIDGREAAALGVASRVAGDDFDRVVDDLARQVAAAGPVAVRAVKRTLRGTFDRSIDDALLRESNEQAMTFTTADAREGIAAIQEKRSPRFSGT